MNRNAAVEEQKENSNEKIKAPDPYDIRKLY